MAWQYHHCMGSCSFVMFVGYKKYGPRCRISFLRVLVFVLKKQCSSPHGCKVMSETVWLMTAEISEAWGGRIKRVVWRRAALELLAPSVQQANPE